MSLADRLPGNRQLEINRRSVGIVAIHCLLFLAALIVLLLLQRLGMSLDMMILAIITVTVLLMTTLSWLGRTMTSPLFFFAGRNAEPAMNGIGGLSDWVSGGVIVYLLSASYLDQLLLVPAVTFGLALQFALFSPAMQMSRTSSTAGYLNWRYGSRTIGLIAFSLTFSVTVMLVLTEFIIAREIFVFLSNQNYFIAGLIVACISIVPSLFGGWLAMHTLNAAVVLWILVCLLFPAVLVGVAPGVLELIVSPTNTLETLPQIDLSDWRLPMAASGGTLEAIVVVIVASFGFSTLPQVISRTSLMAKTREAVQSLSWSSMFVFLLFSAVPLSLSLVVKGHSPQSALIADELTQQTVIHILPYIALLMLALNGLCLTVWMLSSSTIRIIRRSRNLNPDERSMFWVRCLAVFVALVLASEGSNLTMSPTQLLVDALLLSASVFFLPLFAASWLTGIGRLAIICSMLFGTAGFLISKYHFLLWPDWRWELSFSQIGSIGIVGSIVPIAIAWISTTIRKVENAEPSARSLAIIRD